MADTAAENVSGAAPRGLQSHDPQPPRTETPRTTTSRRFHRRHLGLALVVAVLAVEIVLVWPYLGRAAQSLRHPNLWWVALAIAAELASMAAFARLQRRMLSTGGVRVSMCRMLSLTYAANAVSATLPAGAALSSGYQFRRFRGWGASAPLAGFTLLASGVLGTFSFGLLCVLAAVLAGAHDANPIELVLGGALAIAATYGVRRLRRDPQSAIDAVERRLLWTERFGRRDRERTGSRIGGWLNELFQIKPRKRDWAAGLGFAAFNWIADLVCLLAACRAIGADDATLTLAAVAYVAGMAVSSISLIPGGLGVVDAAMILTLTHGGLTASSATAGVLLYRLISFAFVVAIGWVFWAVSGVIENRTTRTVVLAWPSVAVEQLDAGLLVVEGTTAALDAVS
jgi:uncharacterized protein (TIRG00374 family)